MEGFQNIANNKANWSDCIVITTVVPYRVIEPAWHLRASEMLRYMQDAASRVGIPPEYINKKYKKNCCVIYSKFCSHTVAFKKLSFACNTSIK